MRMNRTAGVEGRPVRICRLCTGILAAAILAAAPAPTAAAAQPTAGRESGALTIGSRGRDVRALQRRLGLPPDGIFGQVTARAVRRFQRRRGLAVTGRVDERTRKALGLASPAPPPSTGGAVSPDDVSTLADAARTALGRPYGAGATGPEAFDCSGLVVWAGRIAGLDLPRSSFEQYKVGTALTSGAIAAGDLVFFDTNGPGASDVAIATSATTAISATTHGVREHPIFGAYWGEHFVGARRVG